MSNYAVEIDSNKVVVRAIVCDSVEWAAETLGGEWLSCNVKVGVGSTFDSERGVFIPIQPFPSWILNEETNQWEAPIARPDSGEFSWNEKAGAWVEA